MCFMQKDWPKRVATSLKVVGTKSSTLLLLPQTAPNDPNGNPAPSPACKESWPALPMPWHVPTSCVISHKKARARLLLDGQLWQSRSRGVPAFGRPAEANQPECQLSQAGEAASILPTACLLHTCPTICQGFRGYRSPGEQLCLSAPTWHRWRAGAQGVTEVVCTRPQLLLTARTIMLLAKSSLCKSGQSVCDTEGSPGLDRAHRRTGASYQWIYQWPVGQIDPFQGGFSQSTASSHIPLHAFLPNWFVLNNHQHG